MIVESDADGAIANEQGRLDPPCGGPRTERLGANLWVIVEAGSCVIFRNEAVITLTIAELEELVRVTARHGILNLAGGRS